MWRKTGQFIINYRGPLLILLLATTGLMAYWASKVELSYEFSRAIPANHPANKTYQEFKKKYGQDGNMLVIGIQTDKLFTEKTFNDYASLHRQLKALTGVIDVISLPSSVNLVKDSVTEKLNAVPLFPERTLTQAEIDSSKNIFLSLPFYRELLYNPETNAWTMGVSIDKGIMNSAKRKGVVENILKLTDDFGKKNNLTIYLSGLPLIRTQLAARISNEMKWFLLASLLLSALILLLFFRSVSSMLLSLAVVIIGVVWSLGTMHLLGYNITLLTALIPPLIVVIGIPNCIYFLNKYHTSWEAIKQPAVDSQQSAVGGPSSATHHPTSLKHQALVSMVDRMGIVTLFCNLSAAIGFAVFALTKSEILQEFGVVAGINIMALFFISLILIPAVLCLLPPPKPKHTKYIDNPRLNRWLDRLEHWSLNHRKFIYITTLLIIGVAVAGIFRLKSVGYIVDDLPKTDKIYTDLKFFEKNFKGVMPLEILVDTKKRYGIRNLGNLLRIDSLSQYLTSMPSIARPLSIAEGMKFAKQAFFDGDSANYSMPGEYLLPALAGYLSLKGDSTSGSSKNSFGKLVATFMDSARQEARISINMADVGTARLPMIRDSIQRRADQLFDSTKYKVTLTGTSITFLEGSTFIIHGLKESIFWAFLLIAICMLYLFRSARILLCSLIPNIVPLVITAGVMGWAGIPLKPSTVLIFSVALGIAIDITIRFLVNFKQELPHQQFDMEKTVIETIHGTGISIIYTSLVLIAGFIIFSFSGFGGTQALGWLTSLTLITATFTNLVLLPTLLMTFVRYKKK